MAHYGNTSTLDSTGWSPCTRKSLMAFWLMRWVWARQSRPSLCSLTSPVKKVTNLAGKLLLFLHTAVKWLNFSLLVFFLVLPIFVYSNWTQMFLLSSFDLLFSGNWGPHLIIVPTSVMLNWEMELKRWCPGFKILTYFGSQKERKLKRQVMSSLVWNSKPYYVLHRSISGQWLRFVYFMFSEYIIMTLM